LIFKITNENKYKHNKIVCESVWRKRAKDPYKKEVAADTRPFR